MSFAVIKEKKKKDFLNILDIEVTGQYLWRQFRKNQNFGFYGPKDIGLNLGASCYDKKKNFPNPLDIEVTGPDLWHQLWKNQNFCSYGPKGKGPDQ